MTRTFDPIDKTVAPNRIPTAKMDVQADKRLRAGAADSGLASVPARGGDGSSHKYDDTLDDTAPQEAPEEEPRPKLQLTATQISTGVAASITTALLGSGLGVAGTVVGAGVGSAVSITAAALYTHSIAATKHRLHRVKGHDSCQDHAHGQVHGGNERRRAYQSPRDVDGRARNDSRGERTAEASRGVRDERRARASRWPSVLAGALGSALAFALALVLVTGIESVKGAPLAGGHPGGLSVLGGASMGEPDPSFPSGSRGGADVEDEAPPVTSTKTETSTSVETSTQTVVSTPPTPDQTDSVPSAPGDEPEDDGSDGGTDGDGGAGDGTMAEDPTGTTAPERPTSTTELGPESTPTAGAGGDREDLQSGDAAGSGNGVSGDGARDDSPSTDVTDMTDMTNPSPTGSTVG